MDDILGKLVKYAGLCLAFFFLSFVLYESIVQDPKAGMMQKQLELEFNAIDPFPGAAIVEHDAFHKPDIALVETSYLTSANVDAIFNYYDQQLKKQGWQFSGAGIVTEWGEDLGGKSAYFCKSDYTASVQYAGQQANRNWTYNFDVSWGLGDCKTEVSGGWVKQTLPFSLLMMAFGSYFSVFSGYHARNAWTKNEGRYILMLVGVVMGILVALIGTYNLWRNIVGT